MVGDLSQFHFIRPLWLLAIPVLVFLWFLIKRNYVSTHWEAHIDQRMLQAMRVGGGRQSKAWRWALLLAWIIASLAAAGPSWQQNTVPTLQNQNAMIIVLDLSASMLAQDLSPDRLTQAKYKLIDILRAREDGQTGLIAYAGDAHTVSPLTDDPNAIEVLLPALHPSIMPVSGSNTESAIELAQQLLGDSGVSSGQILLITDGVHDSVQASILQQLDRAYALSILGVGGTEAAPIPLAGGGFLRGSNGEIVLTAPDHQALNRLAQAAGGRFSSMRLNGSDIDYLINDDFDSAQSGVQNQSSTVFDSWADMGHWLVLLLLPIAALCFRKGVIYVLPLFILLPYDSNAAEWQDLWQTPDQQAQQLLEEDPQAAAQTFERQDWAGVANYQAGNYTEAAQQFATQQDAQGHYNRGNALALNGELDAAIEAYAQALEKNPELEDAQFNKELVEQLKQQQEQQQDQDSSDQDSESQEQSDQSQQSQEQQSENSDESDQSESDSEQQEQESQSDSTEQEPTENETSSETEEPSASEEPSANQEPSANEEQQENESEEESQTEAETEPDDEEAAEQDQQAVDYLVEETPDQLKDSSERWLRSINDDPTGLLRRKFQYESYLRSRQQSTSQSNNNSSEERY